MTPNQIKLNMTVMTPKGKGVVVGWTASNYKPYLVKLENGGRHNGCAPLLIEGSTKKLNGDGHWFSCEDLTAIEEQMTEQTQLVPFTDEFDWCEEGVLVMAGHQERYAVRAKGNFVWVTLKDKIPCSHTAYLTTYDRTDCKKVIHEVHRPLTNREFAEFMQDHKGMVKSDAMICYSSLSYNCREENESVRNDLLFRFRGTEEWHQVTTELYDIAKGLDA